MSNTQGGHSSVVYKAKEFAQLVLKYGSTSIIATTVDLTTFGFVKSAIGVLYATVAGRLVGAVVAFLLHQKWVFEASQLRLSKRLIAKYLAGVFFGMGLNVLGVWFLNSILKIDAWTSRVTTAVSVWGLVFLFNKYFVFKEPLVDVQDFADIEDDVGNKNTEGC